MISMRSISLCQHKPTNANPQEKLIPGREKREAATAIDGRRDRIDHVRNHVGLENLVTATRTLRLPESIPPSLMKCLALRRFPVAPTEKIIPLSRRKLQ